MRTKASIAAHPIHPMLVPIPIGALPTALVFDVLNVVAPAPAWSLGALVATAVAAAGILAALVPGFIDYRWSVPKRGAVHGLARAHMGLGLGLAAYVVLFALARWLALGFASAWTPWVLLGMSLLAVTGLTAQGVLGGELRARHRLGVEPGPDVAPTNARVGPPPSPHGKTTGPKSGGGAPGAP